MSADAFHTRLKGRGSRLPRLSALPSAPCFSSLSAEAPSSVASKVESKPGSEFTLRFRVRVSLSTGKKPVSIGPAAPNAAAAPAVSNSGAAPAVSNSYQSSANVTRSQASQLGLQPSAPAMAAEQRLCAPYEFYCGAWMGGSNPHMDFQVLKGLSDGAGEASMSLRLQPGDVDTFKVGVYVRDASAKVMRHVASGFNTLSWLRDGLAGADSCDSAKQSLLLKDNYTPNQALLHFCSDSSDVPGLEALLPSLTPSALHRNDWLNSKVVALSYGLHDLIEELCNVSNLNGGASFVNSTF